MAFVKIVCCVIAFVIGIGIMQGFDFIVNLIKKRGVHNEKKDN